MPKLTAPRAQLLPFEPEVVVGSDPAAGVEISVTVPAGEIWLLESLIVTLVTDATVTNRYVSLAFDDGTTEYGRVIVAAAQAESLTMRKSFLRGLGSENTGVLTIGSQASLPDFALLPGHRIRSITTNLQAGDNFGAPVLYVVKHYRNA